MVLWANVELGYQVTDRDGAMMRFYGGVGHMIARGGCARGECGTFGDLMLPYVGLAFGKTF